MFCERPLTGDLVAVDEIRDELDLLEEARIGVMPFDECSELTDVLRKRVGVDERDGLCEIEPETERAAGLRGAEFRRYGPGEEAVLNRSRRESVRATGFGEVDEVRDGELEFGAESESWSKERRSSASAPAPVGFAAADASLGSLTRGSPDPLGAAIAVIDCFQ